jgi:hypothetical protein
VNFSNPVAVASVLCSRIAASDFDSATFAVEIENRET